MIARLTSFWKRSGWNEFVWMSAGLAFVLGVAGFLWLMHEVPEGEHLALEENLMRSLRQPDDLSRIVGPPWVQEVSRDVSALGSAVTLTVMTIFVLGYLLLKRGYAAALLVVVAVAGGYGLSATLKNLLARERPSVVPHLSYVTSQSFPSGHSMLSSVVYLTLGAMLAQTAKRRVEKIYFMNVALGLSVLIGVSRVLLGVHYPTDVLAGWGAGTAWAVLCWAVASWMKQRGAMPEQTGGVKSEGRKEKMFGDFYR